MQGISGKRQVLGLVGWLLLVFVAGAIGAAASVQAATFYATLAQPSWAPPAAVFGPVWSVLYVLMGIAAWLVWRCGGWAAQRRALTVFVAQLALNALWSWLFFGWHLGAAAMLDIVVPVGADRGHSGDVLARAAAGRRAAAAVSGVGHFRQCAQLRGMAAQPAGAGLSGAGGRETNRSIGRHAASRAACAAGRFDAGVRAPSTGRAAASCRCFPSPRAGSGRRSATAGPGPRR
ncbi:tryptophan-rich sensory protein [Pseudoxanthomonas sp. SORGH_AS 997]|nr:tryptophan-rich sensory protein [Pseudoxanthomonas sp. SORGH_AS_0997]